MLFQFPMESMNSGKGVPCRALEILTFMYNCGSGGRALPPSCEKRKRGKKILRCFFPCGIQSRSTSYIFQREKAESPFQLPSASESAFKRHPFEALQRAGEHAITEPR